MTAADVSSAVAAAAAACSALADADRATLLRTAADRLESLGDELVIVADAETGLGAERLNGERARTCGQLRLFAEVVEDGSYVDAIIDHAYPTSTPPRPDLRRMLLPLGPVAVFGAGNFPLAFGVAGGDTASAWAVGCPVVVKAHPDHPRTSELCAGALSMAAASCGLPPGTISLVHGGNAVGHQLVQAPPIRAVAFTGSLVGGRALFELAAARPEPVPVYAEMGSINPLFITTAALAARGERIAEGFVASMTLGTGQFCTKPGVVVVPTGPPTERFVTAVADALSHWPGGVMLAERVRQQLDDRLRATLELPGVDVVARGGDSDGLRHEALVLAVDAPTFASTPALVEEHFGPVAVMVRCPSDEDLRGVAELIPGSLTATVHAEPGDAELVASLGEVLQARAGRLVFNGFPTGVAVTAAMQHGGPYPASTSPLHTSVGTTAIRRFLRPVAYQDAPAELLPPALRDGNPLGLRRLVDGVPTTGSKS